MENQQYDAEAGGNSSVPVVEAMEMENAPASSQISNDERWALIWGVLIIYWAFDAVVVFLTAFVGFLANTIFYFAAPGECTQADTLFVLSMLIFLLKFIDMTLGCCMVGCWFCPGGSRSGSREEQLLQQEERYKHSLLPHIRKCILVCLAQMGLSLGGIVTFVVGMVQSPEACAGSGVGMIFNIILFLDSGWELFIWVGAYLMRKNQGHAPISDIVDKIVPNFLWEWAKKQQL